MDDTHDKHKGDGKCHHRPTQSLFYHEHKDDIEIAQSILAKMFVVTFVFLIFVSAWKKLEEGTFPFNIGFMADIAYSKHKFGTPALALIITIFVSYTLIEFRRYLFRITEAKIKATMISFLDGHGLIRNIIPQNPK